MVVDFPLFFIISIDSNLVYSSEAFPVFHFRSIDNVVVNYARIPTNERIAVQAINPVR